MNIEAIFFDADEVINYFAKYVVDRYNFDYNENFNWEDIRHFQFHLNMTKADAEYFDEVMAEPGLWTGAEPVEGAVETVRKLIEDGFNVQVCTAPQWNNACLIDKKDWFIENLPFFNLNNMCYYKNKQFLANPRRVLLDDSLKNLTLWRDNGGIAVAFDRPWNKDWDGPRVHSHEEFYKLIWDMEGFKQFLEESAAGVE